MAAIRQACPEAAAVCALAGYFDAEIHVKNGNLEANNPYLLGTDEDYLTATAYSIGLGRFFTPAEDRTPVAAAVVVLSHDCWRLRFFSDAGVIGQTVPINGAPL